MNLNLGMIAREVYEQRRFEELTTEILYQLPSLEAWR